MVRRGALQVGDHVQLRGPKGILHTITLEAGGSFHTHKGQIFHDDLIGHPEGSVVTTDRDVAYLALRPMLSDFVLSMARGAAIIYPKDAAQIVSLADIQPGHRVMEAGVGSGALSMSILRAVGGQGSLISLERRDEFAAIARANAEAFFGHPLQQWSIEVGDFQDLASAHSEDSVDRVVLDMLAPWECVDAVSHVLIPGGVLAVYVATVTQLSRVVEAVRGSERFTNPESLEVLLRPWHVEGLAVRPEHRMIGHTGFLMTARALAPGVVLPETKRRVAKPEYSDEDVEAWTPGATGQRHASDKKIRKTVRQAQERAEKSAREVL
ncbi:tRNA (adenine-N1)-methyltransferase [Pontimonas sp.]|nr:tRNA (adenine-N1)-methyltransferase [Pontimonas sp.]MDA8862631.1 tRNA (adenine-N1)-methyltransferase [Pontimonas sp.]